MACTIRNWLRTIWLAFTFNFLKKAWKHFFGAFHSILWRVLSFLKNSKLTSEALFSTVRSVKNVNFEFFKNDSTLHRILWKAQKKCFQAFLRKLSQIWFWGIFLVSKWWSNIWQWKFNNSFEIVYPASQAVYQIDLIDKVKCLAHCMKSN